jgi:hypothetical protein
MFDDLPKLLIRTGQHMKIQCSKLFVLSKSLRL